nr:hypothetical protein [Tanacetum cinerariifolium]
ASSRGVTDWYQEPRPVVLVLPGLPIPIGRPYHTQPNGVLKMLTTRKSYATSDSLDDSSTATSARPSRNRCKPPTLFVPVFSHVREALSPDSYEPYTDLDIDLDIQIDINECITYANTIRARGMDDRDVVKTVAKEEVEVDPRVGPVIEDDVCESVRDGVFNHVAADGVVEVIESEQRLHEDRITEVDLKVTNMTKRISALEWDNTRLRGMLDVEIQKVD